MRKNTNIETIEGYLYEHDLKFKTVEDKNSENFGKEYFSGTISIATDEECLNVLSVHFTYVPEYTKKTNKKNNTYTALQKIYKSGTTVITHGKENAMKLKVSTAAALNDFYPQGQDEVVSQPRNEGGFVTILSYFDIPDNDVRRNKFVFDMLITNIKHIDVDPDKNINEAYTEIRGAIFNFRNDLLPFTIIARSKGAMDYFENKIEASMKNPVYTQVWGKIVSSTITVTTTTKSAFGEDAVDVTQRKTKEWVVTGAKEEAYEFDTESTITKEELETAVQNRNIMLADIKKKRDEFYNKNAIVESVTNDIPEGEFKF